MKRATINLDDLLTPEQFAAWQGMSLAWVVKRLPTLPGVISESREHTRIHPRTYLENRLKRKLT